MGYTFSGWHVPDTMPAENITVDAALTANMHTVTFVDGMTGEVIVVQDVQEAFFAEAPEAPIHAGYTFIGWTVDGEFVNADAYPVMGEVTFVV